MKLEYGKYLEVIDDVFSKYNGEYLAVEDTPSCLKANGTTHG